MNKLLSSLRLPTAILGIFCFSFCTGYSYSDAEKFIHNDTATGIGRKMGLCWPQREQQSQCPCLDFGKYWEAPGNDEAKRCCQTAIVIPKSNAYLKKIADVCTVKKNQLYPWLGTIFATTATLTNGVPIGTVKWLGHTGIWGRRNKTAYLTKLYQAGA